MIATVSRNGNYLIVKNEKGQQIGCFSVASNAEILNYTASTITIKTGAYAKVVNEKGIAQGPSFPV